MTETPTAYIARILSSLGDQDPRQVLATTAGRLRELISARSREELAWSPEPGRWSTTEILAHLADTEIVSAWRIRSILASDGVGLQPFDQDAWAAAFRYRDADPSESLQVFAAIRSATLALLARVDPARHANHGLHQERGKETIDHLIRLYAGHDRNHLAQIEKLLAASHLPSAS